MATALFLLLLLCTPEIVSSQRPRVFRPPSRSLHTRSNVPAEGFFNPKDNGGSMLTVRRLCHQPEALTVLNSLQQVINTFPPGLGEPLNVIITGNSDPDVLKDQETDGGLRNYFLYVLRVA